MSTVKAVKEERRMLKERRIQARERASEVCRFATAMSKGGAEFRVNLNGYVHPAEGGCFVEALVWVPEEVQP